MACNCGGRAGAGVEYVARASNGTSQTFANHTEAKLFLATNGGGSVKAQPKKAA